jgi:predicted nucleotidyltransferase
MFNDYGREKITMRLTQHEQASIIKAFHSVFGEGKIYLFGSRVDDAKKGGDIDLYLCPKDDTEDMFQKKIKFLVNVQTLIGEQKIDVVMAKDENRLIEQIALQEGILLNRDDLKWQKYLHECDKHLFWIEESFSEVKDIFPLSAKKYQALDAHAIKNIDQYLFRFSKLQDTTGEKLFRLVVQDFIENIDRMTFIDILNQLEKIEILENAQEWRVLRDIRNNIAHQYDDDPEEMADALNKIFAQKEILIEIYNKIKKYYQSKDKNEK